MIPTPTMVAAVVDMSEDIQQLSLDPGYTRREVKGHTPTPITRGEVEMGKPYSRLVITNKI